MPQNPTTTNQPTNQPKPTAARRPQSDVWALGCILVELSTLSKAFESSSMSKIILSILKGAHRPLPDCYGPGLRGLVAGLLRVAPGERPSVEQVLGSEYVR